MRVNEHKLRAVTNLAGPERYSHFIKVAADQRSVWGLYQHGWALVQGDKGQQAFPLWPGRAYAEQCAIDIWDEYEAREIDLDTFLGVLIPRLISSNTQVAIFPTPAEKGVVPQIDMLEADIRQELGRIE